MQTENETTEMIQDDPDIPIIFTPDPRFPEGQFYGSVGDLAEWSAKSKEFEYASEFLVRNTGEILIQSVPDLPMVLKGVIHGNAELSIFGENNEEMAKGVAHVMKWFDACLQAHGAPALEGDNDNG